MRRVLFSTVTLVATMSSLASAGLVSTFEVGTGANASNVQFQFTNGNSYLFIVRWEGVQTGRTLFDIVDAAQPVPFSFETQTFTFGESLIGVSIGGDSDSGFGTPPDYLDFWHYWSRESNLDPWDFALVGFADRVVANGSWDGWVFGSNDAPAAVPTPGAIALFVGAALGRRRRARS